MPGLPRETRSWWCLKAKVCRALSGVRHPSSSDSSHSVVHFVPTLRNQHLCGRHCGRCYGHCLGCKIYLTSFFSLPKCFSSLSLSLTVARLLHSVPLSLLRPGDVFFCWTSLLVALLFFFCSFYHHPFSSLLPPHPFNHICPCSIFR